MSKQKPKKKHEENNGIQQIIGCSYLFIRMVAGFMSLIFMTLALIFLYIQTLYAIDMAIFVAMAGVFSYLAGYLALYFKGDDPEESEHMRDTLDEDKRKNDRRDDDFED